MQTEKYTIFRERVRERGRRLIRSTEEWLSYYEELAERFPIDLIEEPLGNNDREGWEKIEERLGGKATAGSRCSVHRGYTELC